MATIEWRRRQLNGDNLQCNVNRFCRLDLLPRRSRHSLAQRLALDVFSHDIAQARVFRRSLADLVNRDDIRMVKRARGARFLREAAYSTVIGREGGGQELEGDFTPESRVERKMYFAHPAAPERREKSVGADLRRRD